MKNIKLTTTPTFTQIIGKTTYEVNEAEKIRKSIYRIIRQEQPKQKQNKVHDIEL